MPCKQSVEYILSTGFDDVSVASGSVMSVREKSEASGDGEDSRNDPVEIPRGDFPCRGGEGGLVLCEGIPMAPSVFVRRGERGQGNSPNKPLLSLMSRGGIHEVLGNPGGPALARILSAAAILFPRGQIEE